jgi:uncharacterized protein YbjT (DUF2867 family)
MSSFDLKPVLVMGARGSIGAHVLAELLERGRPVRASVRRPAPGLFPDGLDVRTADLTDPRSLDAAFDGVGQVFLYAEQAGLRGVIDSARNAGIVRVVLLSSGSVVHPPSRGNAITEEHRAVEDAFLASGLTVVPIRPLVLATNALHWSRPIAATRSVALYRPDAATAPIHERDIASVVVAALDGHEEVSGLLTGPARMTQREQVAAIGAALGARIAVTELARDEAIARLARFMPEHEALAVVQFLDDAAAGASPATDAVEAVLGRSPIAFEEWAAEHAHDFEATR